MATPRKFGDILCQNVSQRAYADKRCHPITFNAILKTRLWPENGGNIEIVCYIAERKAIQSGARCPDMNAIFQNGGLITKTQFGLR